MGTMWIWRIFYTWYEDAFHWMIFEGVYEQEKMVIFDKHDVGLNAIPFQLLSTPTIPDYG